MSFPAPSVTPPSLSNWQLSYNGLTVGADTPYDIQQVTGLDLPAVRTGDVPRPRDLGEFEGLDLLAGRDITVSLDVVSDGTSLQHALLALQTALVPGVDIPLWIQVPNSPLYVAEARVRKRTAPLDQGYATGGIATASFLVHASDPRFYAAPTSSATVGLPTPGGGLTFPVTFPVTFGGGGSAGVITAVNAGNVEMRPILVITGPCTNPTVENTTTGWSLTFSNPEQVGYTLNAGDQLVVDTDAGSIIYYPSGSTVGSSRTNWIVAGSVWPGQGITPLAGLAPGSNTVEFSSADSSSVAGTLTLEWASAYLSAT